MKSKIIVLVLILLGIILAWFFVKSQKAGAYYDEYSSDNCRIEPTPTPTITQDDEITLTATPTEEPSVTPLPSVSPEPTATPSAEQSPGTNGTQGDYFTPTCNIPFNAPLLQGFQRLSPTSVNFSWWGVEGIDRYSIVYGYSQDQLIYGVNDIGKGTSFTINSLEANRTVWAQVYAWKGQCASISNPLDP